MLVFPENASPKSCWVKVCGFTERDAVSASYALGASAVGLNFWPGSKRYVEPEVAASWAGSLPEELVRIGVFVNANEALILDLLDRGVIHAAQLHGDEMPEQCAAIRSRGFPVLKAIGVRSAGSLSEIDDYEVDAIVLDAFAPDHYGGTGRVIDWDLAQEAVLSRPQMRVILSGGLTPENVREAVERVRPFGVDVASGVESTGIKDLAKVKKFIEAVHSRLL